MRLLIIKYDKYNKFFYCIVLLAVFIAFATLIKYYFKPFFIIIIILFLCTPIDNMLCKINLFNPKVNALISLIFVNILFFLAMFFIGNLAYNAVNYFTSNFTKLTVDLQNLLKDVGEVTNIDLSQINDSLLHMYKSIISGDFLKKGAIYTTDGLLSYFIGNMATYFILSDKYVIVNHVKNFLPRNKIYILKDKIEDINKMFKVEVILVIITSVETIIGLMILDISNCVPLGILCGMLDIMPYVGTIMIFLPLTFYKIICREYIIAFGIVCLYILLIINRQILETKFMSDRLEVHPLFIILSLYIGVKVFGLIGLFMGPLYVITVKEILRYKS